ncbi:hypothetical protein [Actinophytocola algeriensis]|uniref:DUF3093 family protein n=1 Tax=Actinophytocola algeriensis TaxID=1768010 RepID=A0A7W7VIS8_9PSEU|nr:hypothetical protein [Actinophytocola algeriensis]MBB4911836.1 hypothetical protein [Actinophytocola algeriensis]MBE1477672.1 hypothetical protein [Actinophytocola algeriensis]
MTDGPVLYAEPGSTRWPLLWGPAFAGIGAGVEALSGPVHTVAWLIVGIGLFGIFALWTNVRRKVYRVELTPAELRQGRETLPVKDIQQVTDVGAAPGAKILGGGWSVPRKTYEVPLRLDDGSTVLAWARDDDALKAALARLVGEVEED